jgi:hypothetical protein
MSTPAAAVTRLSLLGHLLPRGLAINHRPGRYMAV